MFQKKEQTGRSLVETLAVLVLIAILTVAGLLGYGFVIRKYQEKQTVKQVAELGVRYALNRVKPNDQGQVLMKSVYPEAERADPYTVVTPDHGHASIKVLGSTSAFSVLVNNVMPGSCRGILASGAYDALLYDIQNGEEFTIGSDYFKDTEISSIDVNKFTALKGKSKEDIIEEVCTEQRKSGRLMSLIWDGDCPKTGASYWYQGKCWRCPSSQAEDAAGNCCDKDELNACGYCPGKCPNGGHCQDDSSKPNYGMCVECLTNTDCKDKPDNKHECDTEVTNKCVECVFPGGACKTKDNEDGFCKRNHTCEPCNTKITPSGAAESLFRWNPDTEACECNKKLSLGAHCLVVEDVDCCVEGTSCQNVDDQQVCTECTGDYNQGTKKDCPEDTPLCDKASGSSGKTCGPCPSGLTYGESCSSRSICGCDTSKGLTCTSEGVCKCQTGVWNPAKGRCVECNNTPDCAGNTETGKTSCDSSQRVCTCPAGMSLNQKTGKCVYCWNEGSTVHGCPTAANPGKTVCDEQKNNGLGECVCPDQPGYGESCSSECGCSGGYACLSGKCECPVDRPYRDATGVCRACLLHYGETGTGACLAEHPRCDKNGAWTCGDCPSGYNWSTTSFTCKIDCPTTLPGYGETCNEECGCADSYSCNAGTLTCVCKRGMFWNATVKKCTTCLRNYDGSKGTGACEYKEEPVCKGDWTCGPCSGGQVYDEVEHVCKCPTDKPYKDSNGICRACLRNNGEAGEGQCPDVLPVCDNKGENAPWICKSCQAGLTWDRVRQECTCPSGTYWNTKTNTCTDCLLHYGENGDGACPSVHPKCDKDGAWTCGDCPSGLTWDAGKQACVSNPNPPNTVIYESKPKCCSRGLCSCCGGTCDKGGNVELYPGRYEIIAIGAGGGYGRSKNGKGKHNQAAAAAGGSGASYKGTLRVTSKKTISITIGDGGGSDSVKEASTRGKTGGKTKIDGIVECPGGQGGYA